MVANRRHTKALKTADCPYSECIGVVQFRQGMGPQFAFVLSRVRTIGPQTAVVVDSALLRCVAENRTPSCSAGDRCLG